MLYLLGKLADFVVPVQHCAHFKVRYIHCAEAGHKIFKSWPLLRQNAPQEHLLKLVKSIPFAGAARASGEYSE